MTFAGTARILRAAKKTSRYSLPLYRSIATVSPGRTPAASMAPAKRAARCSKSRHEVTWPPCSSAMSSGIASLMASQMVARCWSTRRSSSIGRNGQGQILVAPWSTVSCVPVIVRASSLARKRTALAMSSGLEMGGSNQYWPIAAA